MLLLPYALSSSTFFIQVLHPDSSSDAWVELLCTKPFLERLLWLRDSRQSPGPQDHRLSKGRPS